MPHLDPAEQAALDRTVCVLLSRWSRNGRPFYAYVAIRADRMQAYLAAQRAGFFHPEKFGVVIESGERYAPPREVRERMERDYAFDHEGMIDIEDEEEAAEITRSIIATSERRDEPPPARPLRKRKASIDDTKREG